MDYCCIDCGRDFPNEFALFQHLRDSPAHAPGFGCEVCDRSFGGQDVLQQHLRDSTAHALGFDCEVCDRSFVSEVALQQHWSYSKVHSQQRVNSYCITNSNLKPNEESIEIDERTKYIGISPSLIKPVYKLTIQLRRKRPSVEDIVLQTGTKLETPIVAALLNAAERLNSLNESREDAQTRAEKQRQRSQ